MLDLWFSAPLVCCCLAGFHFPAKTLPGRQMVRHRAPLHHCVCVCVAFVVGIASFRHLEIGVFFSFFAYIPLCKSLSTITIINSLLDSSSFRNLGWSSSSSHIRPCHRRKDGNLSASHLGTNRATDQAAEFCTGR